MYAKFDFISEETGRVLISSMLDAPPSGLNEKQIRRMTSTLKKAKKALEEVFGKGQVRLALDAYEGAIFWYLVLFRPVLFKKDNTVFGARKWSIFDMLRAGHGTKLETTDLGVVFDAENLWLTLLWKEAWKKDGVLRGIEECPSLQKLAHAYKKRTNKSPTVEWWKQVADMSAWIIPPWMLHNMKYIEKKLWFHPELLYDDFTVLNLNGMAVLRAEGEANDGLNDLKTIPARNVRFAHHYTKADKREFRSAWELEKKAQMPELEAQKRKEERTVKQALRRKALVTNGKDANREWYLASRLVGELPRALGVGIPGKFPKYLDAATSDKRLQKCIDAHAYGKVGRLDWKRVESVLNELKTLLADPKVPDAFDKWSIWRDRGKAVDKLLEEAK